MTHQTRRGSGSGWIASAAVGLAVDVGMCFSRAVVYELTGHAAR